MPVQKIMSLPGQSCWRFDPLCEYRWFDCKGPLSALADAIWIYGGRDRQLSGQLLVPHWKACLAVIRKWKTGADMPSEVELSVLGPIGTPRWNGEVDNVEIIAVRLQPEAVAILFDFKPGDIVDRDVIWTASGKRFDKVRRLAERGASAERIVCALIEMLVGVANRNHMIDPLTAAVARELRKAGEPPRIAHIAKLFDVSERTLRRRFEHHVGIPPKYYARQFRLKQLLLEMDRQQHPQWATLALDFGYFDQAHMIDDVKSLTGVRPSKLHQMRRLAYE
jgi:AraC-like DNA-binding protein